ncbi:MAG TPA: phage tail protein [Jatrophihabitans sp.]|jgi:phage tail-like protein|nr:phage tail protein [Jatrophihabitans sp.]
MAVLNDQTMLGLANRFAVEIEPGGYNLGSWNKADGLEVNWDMPDYRAGDAGNARWFFPANTKYQSVKLVRAVCDDSTIVQQWLADNSHSFPKARCEVTINLMDTSGQTVIIHWTLHNALPKKWSINSMDAGASQISVETLEFDHEGFLEDGTQW